MTVQSTSPTPIDPLHTFSIPDPSPSLSVLRSFTSDRERFEIEHKPMAAPPLPEPPPKVRAGRRSHRIDTLTDLLKYIERADANDSAAAFYSTALVSCVIDEESKEEREVLTCTLARHPEFVRWSKVFGQKLHHVAFVNFLRLNTSAINAAQANRAEYLVGVFASLRGELVHDADDYLDMQRAAVTLTVKRKKRGGVGEDMQEVSDVPTEFQIAVKVLPDDPEPTLLRILVRFTGDIGSPINATMLVENLEEQIDTHIDNRLQAFAADAGFLCVRGAYEEKPWSEPTLPKSVIELMKSQTEMIEAIAKSRSGFED